MARDGAAIGDHGRKEVWPAAGGVAQSARLVRQRAVEVDSRLAGRNLTRFPLLSLCVLETGIDYRVPPEKVSDLAKFDGSVIFERTKGELPGDQPGERHRDRGADRRSRARVVRQEHEGVSGRPAGTLHAGTAVRRAGSGDDADPDEMTLGETMMHKMGEKLGLTDG